MSVAFLLDVDDTLLDNDRVQEEFLELLRVSVGEEHMRQYWELFEEQRLRVGFADYLGALQRYRVETSYDERVLLLGGWLFDYPFAERLYPGALDVIRAMRAVGAVAIVSDGDAVLQPRKIVRSGLWDAVDGHVFVGIRKEAELVEIERRFPADRYVLVDDKLRILAAVKETWGDRVTTVFPRQGRYAKDPGALAAFAPADVAVDAISELLAIDLACLAAGGGVRGR